MAGFDTMISALAAVMLLVQQKADDCLFLLNLKLTSLSVFFRETLTLPAPEPVTQYITKTVHKTHTATPVTVTTILGPATTLEIITAPTVTGSNVPEQLQIYSFVDKSPYDFLLLASGFITIAVTISAYALYIRSEMRRQPHMNIRRKSRERYQKLVASTSTMIFRAVSAVHLLVMFIVHVIFSNEPDYQFIPLTNILIEMKMSLWTKLMSALGKLYAVVAPPISRFVSGTITFSLSALHYLFAIIAIISPGIITFSVSTFHCLYDACAWVWQTSREYVLEPFGEHICPSVVRFLHDYLWWLLRNYAGPTISDAFIAPYQMAFRHSTPRIRHTRNQHQTPTTTGTIPRNDFPPNLVVTPAQPNHFQVPYTPGSGALQTPNSQHVTPVNQQLHHGVLQENKSLRQDINSLKKKLVREQAQREDAELRAKNAKELNDKVYSSLHEVQEKQQKLEARYAHMAVNKPKPVITHFLSPGEYPEKVTEKFITRKHSQKHKARSEKRLRTMRPLKPRVNILRKSAEQRTIRLAELARQRHKEPELDLPTSQNNTQEERTDVLTSQDVAQEKQTDVPTSQDIAAEVQTNVLPSQDVTPEQNTALLNHENTIQQQAFELQQSSNLLVTYQNILQEQQSRISGFDTSIRDKDSQLEELSQNVANRDSDITRQRQVIQDLEANVNRINTDVTEAGARATEAQTALEEERSRAQRLEQACLEQESQLTQLRQNATEGNARIQQLESEVATMTQLRQNATEGNARIQQLESEVASMTQVRQNATEGNARIQQLEGEVATMRAQALVNGVFQKTAESYQHQNGVLQEQLRQVREELQVANQTIEDLRWEGDHIMDTEAVVVAGEEQLVSGYQEQQPVNGYPDLVTEGLDPEDLIAAGILNGFGNTAAVAPTPPPPPPPSPPAALPGLGFVGDNDTLRIKLKPKGRLRRPDASAPSAPVAGGVVPKVNPFAGLAAGGGGLTVNPTPTFTAGGAGPAVNPSPVVATGGNPAVNPSPIFVPNMAYVAANAAPRTAPTEMIPVKPGVLPFKFDSAQLNKLAAMNAEQLHKLAMTDPARAAKKGSDNGEDSTDEESDDGELDRAFDQAYREIDEEEELMKKFEKVYGTDDDSGESD
ncbi:hypothetical protein LTR10_018117 [Elasticomyces elasticus]|uniref:Uncharacterized protein n=1 Tax=Exophiala sideris TaxID=1016849 RepID=A0ABR0IW89_9EURO|nr:hypothetical protein LTR10_018117 [Elasticomyces elasticus]KAK5021714.1 hypothetical protein LTS07_010756 [Exophiala sideris]KAK5025130.1 hypothetical protein LTR13_010567 [Exophiala sideris]KAK5050146.1 hypothetical protein LTR69_010780 [Exophiala sideris]KAK5176894.1 hypothetical protein LTR44_010590 [Eurotiomycetes sp. CCFEE 6388]